MPCPVTIRFDAQEIDGVVVCAFLAQLDYRENSLWETWINACDGDLGFQMLESLASQAHIDVHLWVTKGSRSARSLRSPNMLKSSVADVLAKARSLKPWSMQQFDAARAAMEQAYPSVQALWNSVE